MFGYDNKTTEKLKLFLKYFTELSETEAIKKSSIGELKFKEIYNDDLSFRAKYDAIVETKYNNRKDAILNEYRLKPITTALKDINENYLFYKKCYESDLDFRDRFDAITAEKDEIDLDTIYSKLIEMASNGDGKLLMYYLDHKGKSKGIKNEKVINNNITDIKITRVSKKKDNE